MSATRKGLGFAAAIVMIVGAAGALGARQGGQAIKDVGDLIVGRWTGQGVFAADYPGVGKKGEKFTSNHTCRWVAGQSGIECEGVDNTTNWTTLYWWDAGARQVKYAAVDSGGNHSVGTIAKQAGKLVWASAGTFADGRRVEYKGETLFQDNGNTRIEAGATILNGVPSEFRDTYKRVAR